MRLSVGAACWFDRGHSDCEASTGREDWQYIFAEGMLGIHKYAICPHYNAQGRECFEEMLREIE